ncbi:MAG: hypothetical protein HZB32_04335 [Nitrospirae bacterium]|nr:hypothetical protein [Nitrospirota bacterium]
MDIIGADEKKYPNFPSFGPDFFQISLYVDEQRYFDKTLAWEPTGGFIPVSIDISSEIPSIMPGMVATLSFLLFDEDD